MVCELLIFGLVIRNLIRDNKTHQLYSQMQMGQAKSGMQTLNQCLFRLVHQRLISRDEALQQAYDPEELLQMLAKGGA